MKRFIALTFALVCVLCMAACGTGGENAASSGEQVDASEAMNESNNDTETKDSEINIDDSASYLGDWVYDTGKGNIITFHFNKGGAGYYEQSTKADTKWEFSWEVKDGVLVATSEALGTTFTSVFEFSDDGTLTGSYNGEETGPYVKK